MPSDYDKLLEDYRRALAALVENRKTATDAEFMQMVNRFQLVVSQQRTV